MTVFSAAVDAIFNDPNMAADAQWLREGFGPPVPCRIIRKAPDNLTDFGRAQVHSETTLIDVRVSEIPDAAAKDRIVIGEDEFIVQGKPLRDRERLVWTLDLRPAG